MLHLREHITRGFFTGLFWIVLVVVSGIFYACNSGTGDEIQPAGDSYFPLSVGNKWYLAQAVPSSSERPAIPTDSIWIDRTETVRGHQYYRIRSSWPDFKPELWVRRPAVGRLLWTVAPGYKEHPLFVFDERAGYTWFTGRETCLDSLRVFEEYAVVETPYRRFDGVLEIGDVAACSDVGWGVSLARGVGPIRWSMITIAGATEWLLIDAHVDDDQLSKSRKVARIVNGH